MKPNDDELRELLEDVLLPEDADEGASLRVVLDLIRSAREARLRRRRRVASGIAGVAIIGCLALFASPRSRIEPAPDVARIVRAADQPVSRPAEPITPPSIQRVDDDGMLAMLDDRPTAIVSWPDGRRSLLMLAEQPRAKRSQPR